MENFLEQISNHLTIEIYDRVSEAPNYTAEEWNSAKVDKAVVVRKGTVEGNDTVDLQFVDEKGNKYVALITACLLKGLAEVCVTNN